MSRRKRGGAEEKKVDPPRYNDDADVVSGVLANYNNRRAICKSVPLRGVLRLRGDSEDLDPKDFGCGSMKVVHRKSSVSLYRLSDHREQPCDLWFGIDDDPKLVFPLQGLYWDYDNENLVICFRDAEIKSRRRVMLYALVFERVDDDNFKYNEFKVAVARGFIAIQSLKGHDIPRRLNPVDLQIATQNVGMLDEP